MRKSKKYYFLTIMIVFYSIILLAVLGIFVIVGVKSGLDLNLVLEMSVVILMVLIGNMMYFYLVKSIIKIVVTNQSIVMMDMRLEKFSITKEKVKLIEKTLNGYRIELIDGTRFHTYDGAQKLFVEINGILYEGDLSIVLTS